MKALFNNRLLQHIVFWLFYVLLYTANFTVDGKYGKELLITLIYLPFYVPFVYLQMYVLVPKFLLKKKFLAYALLTVLVTKIFIIACRLTFALVIYEIRFDEPLSFPDWSQLLLLDLQQFKTVFSLFMITGLAVSIKLLKKWFFEHDRNLQVEKEKLTMEMEMLKAQVHPHFLFNTLNNLYSLTLTQSDKAPVVVTHLADLLRYMLYQCNDKEVPLSKEIEVLKKYVELEKLRYGDRMEVSFSCSGNTQNLVIAPLLLLPFVENSFKHGMSEALDQCWINIHLHAEEGRLLFNLSNSCNQDHPAAIAGGIGLENIKKRLALLYPEKYQLDIQKEEEMYIVRLELFLGVATSLPFKRGQTVIQLKPAAAV